MELKKQPATGYERLTILKTEFVEIVRCHWKADAESELHSHLGSHCSTLIESGEFENFEERGFKQEISRKSVNDSFYIPSSSRHKMKCVSVAGTTLHFYTPALLTAQNDLFQARKSSEVADLELKLQSQGLKFEDLVKLTRLIQQNSVSTESVMFMNQLFAGHIPEAQLADELISRTRSTLATYEASPIYTEIEIEVTQALGQLLGWSTQDIEGLSVPGGSAANFMALHCARQKAFPDYKKLGLRYLPALKVYCSDQAHYSVRKACVALGFGEDSLVTIATDSEGRMLPSALAQRIDIDVKNNFYPLCVIATAGTTVMGSFDPIGNLSVICQKNNVWLHVDGAWGGPIIFSKTDRDLISGIEHADSFTFDAHKLLGANLTSSLFITRHRRILLEANDVSGADYLFHEQGDFLDRGKLSWQCGRKPDSLALWLIWKSYGTDGLQMFVDRLLHLQKLLVSWVQTQPRLKLIHHPEFLNVCVQVARPDGTFTDDWSKIVRKNLIDTNTCMVNYSQIPKGPTFLRLILAHPQLQFDDLKKILVAALNAKIDH